MSIIRPFAAALVSIALVLAPIATANAMMGSSAVLVDHAQAASHSPMDGNCPCCDMADGCAAAVCGMSCVQMGPASDASYPVPTLGHAAMSGVVPLALDGLAQRPPTPPPRA